jgi:hypothetical protein
MGSTLSAPFGRPRLFERAREEQRRERRLRGRLEHDGAAGGDGGRELVRREVEREVERRDGRDRPDGEAPQDGDAPLAVRREIERDDVAADAARLLAGDVERHGGAINLGERVLDRFARLARQHAADFRPAAGDDRRRLRQDGAALIGRQSAQRHGSCDGRCDGCLDLGLAGQPRRADERVVPGIGDRQGLGRAVPLTGQVEGVFGGHDWCSRGHAGADPNLVDSRLSA